MKKLLIVVQTLIAAVAVSQTATVTGSLALNGLVRLCVRGHLVQRCCCGS